MQPVGRPVGRLIGAMPPDRADLHAAGALPRCLPVENIVAGHQHSAAGRYDLCGDRGRLFIEFGAVEPQYAERDDEDRDQCPPQLAIFPQDTPLADRRSEEHTSELQSLMRISYAVFCLKKKTSTELTTNHTS